MLQSIQMRDFMSKDPVTLQVDTELYDAVHVMLENKITGATVLDDEGRVVGMISEVDLVRALEQFSYYNEGDGVIGNYMSKDVEVIEDTNMNIFDVANKMLGLKFRRLPVVSDGKFIGQISCRSILQAFKDSVCEHDESEDDVHE